MRFWPRSLLGQALFAVTLALLAAQAISAALLYRATEERREQAMLHVAAFRLLVTSEGMRGEGRFPASAAPHTGPRASPAALRHRMHERGRRMPRVLQLETTAADPLAAHEARDADLEQTLRQIVESERGDAGELAVVHRNAGDDPFAVANRGRWQRDPEWRSRGILVAAMREPGGTAWRVARVLEPRREPRALGTLLIQTLVLFLVLVGILAVLLRRITRPLAALTARVDDFASHQAVAGQLAPEGPDDVRDLIAAHNRMEARIAAMLDEKDVMLGAIGHDLKTPLAALRVRIESVEDDTERRKMAAGIEDIARSLDDILSLARVGRASEPPERTDLSALAAAVVEEFEDMGQPVTLGAAPRIVAPIHVTWLRRALRNLVSNAVRYAGGAQVSLAQIGDEVVLGVRDNGPGIPADRIEAMTQPFTRGETSRNRETGGAGLGLTLARAIAEQHGGRLVLTNRPEGGLAAEIRLPLAER